MIVIFSGTAAGWVSARFWRGHTLKHTHTQKHPPLHFFLNEVFIDTEHLEQERQKRRTVKRRINESHIVTDVISQKQGRYFGLNNDYHIDYDSFFLRWLSFLLQVK